MNDNLGDFVHLKSRVLNQPLLLEPSRAEVIVGALADRFSIESLFKDGVKMDNEQLKIGAFSFERTQSDRKPYSVKNGTALVSISGSLVAKTGYLNTYSGMTGYDGIKGNLDIAMNDDSVSEIALMLDSGGGEVKGCFELCDYIYGLRGKGKKITAMVEGIACSACYAIAAAADEIVISENATVGSIGVITAHTSVEKALNDKGIEVTLITAGAHKADGNQYEKLPEEVRGKIQANLDELYGKFAQRVATFRKLSVADVKSTEAATFMGQAAIDNQLADKIMSPIDFLENLSQPSGSNINLESAKMADENTLDKAAITAQAKAEERTRVGAILGCEEAVNRSKLATHLAINTDMDLEAVQSMLSVAAEEQQAPVKVEAETPATKVGAELQSLMADHSAEEAGAEEAGSEITAESDPAAFAVQSYKQAYGA